MRNFINLTTRVINKLHIIEIIKKPSKYEIHMSNTGMDGFFIFSFGNLQSKPNIIEICCKKDKEDYETIRDLLIDKETNE